MTLDDAFGPSVIAGPRAVGHPQADQANRLNRTEKSSAVPFQTEGLMPHWMDSQKQVF